MYIEENEVELWVAESGKFAKFTESKFNNKFGVIWSGLEYTNNWESNGNKRSGSMKDSENIYEHSRLELEIDFGATGWIRIVK